MVHNPLWEAAVCFFVYIYRRFSPRNCFGRPKECVLSKPVLLTVAVAAAGVFCFVLFIFLFVWLFVCLFVCLFGWLVALFFL